MDSVTLTVESLSKEFNRRVVFADISFILAERGSLAVTGKNGSGKSTLAKILCGLLSASKGTVTYSVAGKQIDPALIFRHVGLVSPYISMYDEFSGLENLSLYSEIRNLSGDSVADQERLLKQFGIFERRHSEVRTYSSGMKQRLKYAAALLHQPPVLILDEPTANLDEEGAATVRALMRTQAEQGILIIATNDKDDLSFAQRVIDLNGRSAPTR